MSKQSDPKRYQQLREIINQTPNDPEAWMNLGYFHLDAGEQIQAQKSFRRVLELEPGNIEAQVNLDRILQRKNSENSLKNFLNLEEIKWIETEIPLWLQLIISLFSFVVIFILARVENWTAGNMVWSLWITSLITGYCYLLAGIVSNTFGSAILSEDSLINRLFLGSIHSGIKYGLLIIGILFQLVFFTVHFGLFHFVYSIFLSEFFPIMGSSSEKFSDFLFFISASLKAYWPVILFTLFASIRKFQRILSQNEVDFTKRAYVNVIKIHLSIFLFAGLSATGINEWMFLLIFVIYFFPFSAVLEFLKKLKQKPALAE
jgi:hypothetical protein